MRIIGIHGSSNPIDANPMQLGTYMLHDAAATIVENGEVIAAFEEERLNRIKHTNKFPVKAIQSCLNYCNIGIDEIDFFVFPLARTSSDISEAEIRASAQWLLSTYFRSYIPQNKICLFDHHYCHAACAFYHSSFQDSLVVTIDGSGNSLSASVYSGTGNELKLLAEFPESISLGKFYYLVTKFLGFEAFDEYKVMGLAPYGNPHLYESVFESFFTLKENGNYSINLSTITNELENICAQRSKNEEIEQKHKDVAAALQLQLEKVIFHVVSHFRNITGHRTLCLAGGVALNCTANGKLLRSKMFDDIFVHPASSDQGLSIGGALAKYFEVEPNAKRHPLKHLYLGRHNEENDLTVALEKWKDFISYELTEDASVAAAELIAAGSAIGWIQGRAEFGPRALGNRSILADPRPAENKERINKIVKMREGFRPFAPSVMVEHAERIFDLPPGNKSYPYMTFVMPVKPEYCSLLGAVTHVDGTARLQTVDKSINEKYWRLIQRFNEITGVPVVLNTSFNNNVEPIVDSAEDAIICFITNELNHLIVDNCIIAKKDYDPHFISQFFITLPAHCKLSKDRGIPEIINSYNEKTINISNEIYSYLEHSPNKKSNLKEGLYDLGINISGQVIDEVWKLMRLRALIFLSHPQYRI